MVDLASSFISLASTTITRCCRIRRCTPHTLLQMALAVGPSAASPSAQHCSLESTPPTYCQELRGTLCSVKHCHNRDGRVPFFVQMRSAPCTTLLVRECSLPSLLPLGTLDVTKYILFDFKNQTPSFDQRRQKPFSHRPHCLQES